MEYKRLGENARKIVEDQMVFRELKHSSTYLFLTTLAYKAEMLWPTGERIPFFQRKFEEGKIRQIMDKAKLKVKKHLGTVEDAVQIEFGDLTVAR